MLYSMLQAQSCMYLYRHVRNTWRNAEASKKRYIYIVLQCVIVTFLRRNCELYLKYMEVSILRQPALQYDRVWHEVSRN